MDRNRKQGALRRAVFKLEEKTGQLFGGRRTVARDQEEEVERELRETYDKPTDAIRARSGFRQ
jgi:hypothetical protein